MLKFVVLPVGALLLAQEAAAWWDSGHYFSACVARETLITKGRQDVVDAASKLLALYDDNGVTNDFCRAATWMDWIKLYSTNNDTENLAQLTGLNNLHFIDFLTTFDHSLPTDSYIDAYIKNATLVTLHQLLQNSYFSLRPPAGSKKQPDNIGTVYGQNLLMRWLLHLMGDAHQPMHMTTMWYVNETYPCDGKNWVVNSTDAGGNGILIKLAPDVDDDLKKAAPTNLHFLWDAMGGYDRGYAINITDDEMTAGAKDLIKNYGEDKAKADGFVLQDFTLNDVYHRSAALAASPAAVWGGKFAYQSLTEDNFCPSFLSDDQKAKCCKKFEVTKEHGQWVKDTSKKLVAIAGYRIAWVLQQWFDGLSPRLIKDLDFEYSRQVDTSGASSLVMGSAAAAVAAVGALLYH